MIHPSTSLDSRQVERIDHAIEESTRKTSAHIVPVVARGCGRYERAEDLVGLWAAAVALAIILGFLIGTPIDKAADPRGYAWRLGLLPVLAAITAGFFCGSVIVSRMSSIRRLFVPRSRMAGNVRQRATQLLREHHLHCRDDKLVIVLASVSERMSCIVPDEIFRDALPEGRLDELCRRLDQGIKTGHLDEAMCGTIETLTDMLAPVYPPPAEAPTKPATHSMELVA